MTHISPNILQRRPKTKQWLWARTKDNFIRQLQTTASNKKLDNTDITTNLNNKHNHLMTKWTEAGGKRTCRPSLPLGYPSTNLLRTSCQRCGVIFYVWMTCLLFSLDSLGNHLFRFSVCTKIAAKMCTQTVEASINHPATASNTTNLTKAKRM